ncbi:hypothetical protein PLICRDRAFT_694319 [Plicaturopsis crispa FD-325 SS-3]|nr:hypothetical protein PLICRDRAFT_694319 [Plicaturopsis crispa FD-325 SS-3]
MDGPESPGERALREHIRNLLLPYALTHLTTDYVIYSDSMATQLLSESLRTIPTTDPNSLILPEEPFDTLTRILGLNTLQPYEEKLAADRPTVDFIRDRMKMPANVTCPSERCWDAPDTFDYKTSIYRPMSPILTCRAIRDTKLGGPRSQLGSKPPNHRTCTEMLKSSAIRPVTAEEFVEPPSLDLDEVLHLKHAIDAPMQKAMLDLFKTIPALSRPPPEPYVNSHITDFLNGSERPPQSLVARPISPPIFPRNRNPGSKPAPDAPSSLSQSVGHLASVLPLVEVEDEDRDLYKQHMVVVDGWQTYASSPSPSTPPLGQSSSQIDELEGDFLPSPPNVKPSAIQALINAKLDEVEIPRARKPGGSREKPKKLGQGESLASFLSPLVSTTRPKIVTSPKSQPSSPRTTISLSVLGQPPSDAPDVVMASDDLGTILENVYDTMKGQDAGDWVMNERLEDKDGLLMDVPILPPPNVHPPIAMFHPSAVRDLLAAPKNKDGPVASATVENKGPLRKTKGVQPLNIELSWVPFKYEVRAPTTEELVKVASIDDDAAPSAGEDEQVKTLLDALDLDDSSTKTASQDPPSVTAFSILPLNLPSNFSNDAFEMVLTKSERRRLAGLPERDDCNDEDNDNDDSINLEAQESQPEQHIDTVDESCRPSSRARIDQDQRRSDDSGISFAPQAQYQDVPDDEDDMLDADKENMPPPVYLSDFDSGLEYYESPFAARPLDAEYDQLDDSGANGDLGPPTWTTIEEDEDGQAGDFVPLSFGSFPVAAPPHDPDDNFVVQRLTAGGLTAEDFDPAPTHDHSLPCLPPSLLEPVAVAPRKAAPMALNSSAASHAQALLEFRAMRSRVLPVAVLNASRSSPHISSDDKTADIIPEHIEALPKTLPPDLLNSQTLSIPTDRQFPSALHQYLASMDFIQKRTLVGCLAQPSCLVSLVERESLGGVDLILDPQTAIILFSLAALPSQCDALLTRLSQESWRYSRLLVIFEGFPSSHTYRHDEMASSRETPYAYSPPVLKAVKKLRRDLNLADVYETKNATTSVRLAFANAVDEAAVFVRMFGDIAEENDETAGAIWGVREWLNTDEVEYEAELSEIAGMNAFAAFIVLYQTSPQEFLDMSPEQRIENVGHLIGQDRIVSFNKEIAHRLQALDPGPGTDVGDTFMDGGTENDAHWVE